MSLLPSQTKEQDEEKKSLLGRRMKSGACPYATGVQYTAVAIGRDRAQSMKNTGTAGAEGS
jgi:hypothetical protein